MKHLAVGLFAGLLAALSPALAQQERGDDRIVAARDALRHGNHATLAQLAAARETHPLDHYVEYWHLISRLERADANPPDAEIAAFIERHADAVPGERLRAYWLRRLADDERWSLYRDVFADHPRPDLELTCLSWQARRAAGDGAVHDEVAQTWRELLGSPRACEQPIKNAVAAGTVTEDDLWWRFRREIDSRAAANARTTLGWITHNDAQARAALNRILDTPTAYFNPLPDNFARTRLQRELVMAAIVRVTRHDDALAGYVRLSRIAEHFSDGEQAYLYTVLGHHGALSRLPQASEWYRSAGHAEMTLAQREWRVRAALRAEDWRAVAHTIRLLEADEQGAPEWVYWRARAHAGLGEHDEAERLYHSIAGEPHFYGMLAAEELGMLFTPPAPGAEVPAEARATVRAHPGLQRALLFYRLDMPTEGVREWIHAVRDQPRDFLLAAAHLALEHDLYDRAINTAELADPTDNFAIRFLTPFRDIIEPHAQRQHLDLAWIYGLMRQESRFNIPARSHAGAQGLMQVMPATGQWVAQRLGVPGYHPRMLNDPDTNVMLGTGYMRLILGDLDEHPVLASTGYNAGPGRAQRWRGEQPIDGAIYTATIPIDETRDYVEKVLANKVIYAAMLEDRPQSLKKRLGTVYPRASIQEE